MALHPEGVAHNHPYWLEVQEVTPVSASILWTLRPPPISAIPFKLLRQRQSTQHQQPSASGSSSASKAIAIRSSSEAGITATRSLNRRVTKVTLRNISPVKQNRFIKQPQSLTSNRQQHNSQGNAANQQSGENDSWPSDDETTAVDEDEAREDEEEDPERATDDYTNSVDDMEDGDTPAKIFDSNVSVYVNGIPWSQVMVGDRSSNEAFIVVYGLSPSRDYELVLSVEGEHRSVAKISTTSRMDTEGEDKSVATTASNSSEKEKRTISPSASASPARARAHTPPMQDTDATTPEVLLEANSIMSAANSAAVSSILTGVMNASTLQASIRKARKEASRAESALKNEIEAIKRGLERMSDVDHRSKQKVLALQESIRQANLHAREIDDEAIEVEGEREGWEVKEREKDEELRLIKEKVEESIKEGDTKIKQDDDDLEVVAKELQKVAKLLEEQHNTKEKLEKGRYVEMEKELTKVQAEIENLLSPLQYPQAYNYQQHDPSPMSAPFPSSTSSFSHTMNQRQRSAASQGGFRNVTSPPGSAVLPRKLPSNRSVFGHPRSQEDTSIDVPSGSSSLTHGSALNPHNPEFIPASISSPSVQSRSAQPLQTAYSPSVISRSIFPSTSVYGSNVEAGRSNALPSIGLSPRANTIGSSLSHSPWSGLNASNNQTNHTTNGTSLWTNSSIVPSPTLNHDIWGAPSASVTTMTSNTTAPTSSPLSLRQKTSFSFDIDGPLRRE